MSVLERRVTASVREGRTEILIVAAIHRPERAGLAWEHLRFALAWCANSYPGYFPWTLGRFLLGYVAGTLRWFEGDGAGHLTVFRRLALWGGAVAAVTTTVGVLRRLGELPLQTYGAWGRFALSLSDELGYLAMTSLYVGVAMLLLQRPAWRRGLRIVAPAGRMPLTTYSSQPVRDVLPLRLGARLGALRRLCRMPRPRTGDLRDPGCAQPPLAALLPLRSARYLAAIRSDGASTPRNAAMAMSRSRPHFEMRQ